MPKVTTRYPRSAKAIEDFILAHDPEEVWEAFEDLFFDYLQVMREDGPIENFKYFVCAFLDLKILLNVAQKERDAFVQKKINQSPK